MTETEKRATTIGQMVGNATEKEVDVFMRPRTAAGALDVIGDALRYLRDEYHFVGLVCFGASKDTPEVEGSVNAMIGTELDVATSIAHAMHESENIRDIVIKVGVMMAEKWDEYEARITAKYEEYADEEE